MSSSTREVGPGRQATPPPRRPRDDRPTGGDRVKNAIAVVVALALLIGLGGGAYLGARKALGGFGGSVDNDYAGEGSGTVLVEVAKGDVAAKIGRTLKAKGVTKSVQAFVDTARADDRSSDIAPGAYNLKKKMSAAAALDALLDPASRAEVKVTIPEGLRVTEVVARLVKQTKIPKAQFDAALKNPKLGLPDYAKGNAEGLLFPATYTLDPKLSALEVLQTLVRQTKSVVTRLGLNFEDKKTYRVLTIASMLEEEVRTPEDYGKAARVAQNRLDNGIALGFDSALHYYFGDQRPLTSDIIETQEKDNPYNLRRRQGLPPTPISNPGAATLKAAQNPTPGDWTYFLTIDPKTGKTLFFDNNRDFVNAKNKYGIDY